MSHGQPHQPDSTWWLASDGLWYPPQNETPPPAPTPPPLPVPQMAPQQAPQPAAPYEPAYASQPFGEPADDETEPKRRLLIGASVLGALVIAGLATFMLTRGADDSAKLAGPGTGVDANTETPAGGVDSDSALGAVAPDEPTPDKPDPTETSVPVPVPPEPEIPATEVPATENPSVGDEELTVDIQVSSLNVVWDQSSSSERDDLCMGLEILGKEASVDLFMEGAGNSFNRDVVELWLVGTCNQR